MNEHPSLILEILQSINDQCFQIINDEIKSNDLAKQINELKVNKERVNIIHLRIRTSQNNNVQQIVSLLNSNLVPYLIARQQISIQLIADIVCMILIQLEIFKNLVDINFYQTEFIIKNNVIQIFTELLIEKDIRFQELTIQGLGNFSANNIEFQNISINYGATESILEILKINNSSLLLENSVNVLGNLCLTTPEFQNDRMNKCFSIFCQSLYTLADEQSHQIIINILSLNFKELFQIVSQSAEIIKFNLIPKLIEFLDHKNKLIALQSKEILFKIVKVNHSHQVFDDILLSSHLFLKIPKLLQINYNNELIPMIQRFINQNQYSVKLFQFSSFFEQLIYMIQSYQQRATIDSVKIIYIILRKENVNEVQKLMNLGLLRYLKLLLILVENDDELLILILESILVILKIGIQLTELGKQFKENYYLIEYDQLNMFTQVFNLLKNEKCSHSCSNIINFY